MRFERLIPIIVDALAARDSPISYAYETLDQRLCTIQPSLRCLRLRIAGRTVAPVPIPSSTMMIAIRPRRRQVGDFQRRDDAGVRFLRVPFGMSCQTLPLTPGQGG